MSALKVIEEFEAKSGNGMFPNISRADVASGLRERVGQPETVDQGESSLCGPAALMFAILSKNPEEYAKYVTSLYDTGQGTLPTNLVVKPSHDCRHAAPGGKVSAVDWVSLASLRDSENSIDYEDPSDQVAGITSPSMLSVWLKRTGFEARQNETNVFATKGKDNLEKASKFHDAGHTVCLLCKGDTLKKITGSWYSVPSHWVVMVRAAKIDKEYVTLKVFSWGQFYELNMTHSTFFSTYFGFVCGKR